MAQNDGSAYSRLAPDGGNMTEQQRNQANSLRPHSAVTQATNQTTNSMPQSSGGIGHGTDKKAGWSPLGPGEENAGTQNRAADSRQHGLSGDGALDVSIRVEQDQHNSAGHTTSYGMWIPRLDAGRRETNAVVRDWGKIFRYHHQNGEKKRLEEEK